MNIASTTIWPSDLWSSGPESILRVLIATPIVYIAVIIFIRLSGKRSTSQMNSFDWIVTVAMGSLVASPILSGGVGILESLLAIAILLGLQWLLTAVIVRHAPAARLIKASPVILLYRGEFRPDALRRERVSEQEVLAAIRQSGLADRAHAEAVILESDAQLSVIPRSSDPEQGAIDEL